jgi:glyceraldehyde 3-phosphate dehydrogenase
MKKSAGINGFGRFGLHLVKYWLDRKEESTFIIKYINDDVLRIDRAIQIIKNDNYVIFNKYKIKKFGNIIRFLKSDGSVTEIEYTNYEKNKIPWTGKPELFFECSGKNTMKKDCINFLKGKTSVVIISATCWDVDKTVIYGFNNREYKKKYKIISYGSCTVNAFVPLGEYLNKIYGVKDADVNVVHNIQKYRIEKNYTLNRKFCTLERIGPQLLKFLNKNNFKVNYTVVPYTGISAIDFRFRLKNCPSLNLFIKDMEKAINTGKLKGLYNIHDFDRGPEVHECTSFSAIFIKKNLRIINNQVYIFGYFDNENSANRYYDLVNYITNTI